MSEYIKITDFASKDALLTGNPLKIITGTAHDNEYNAIATAITSKLDKSGGTLTNGILVTTALGTPSSGVLTNCTSNTESPGNNSTQLATTAYCDAAVTAASFPSGTRMPFNQTTAPTGWTKDTTAALNDTAMRIVTGTVGSGGVNAFSTVFGRTASDAYTLQIADIPSHSHVQQYTSGGAGVLNFSTVGSSGSAGPLASNVSDQATGGGGAHSHGMDIRVKYNDFIICQKN